MADRVTHQTGNVVDIEFLHDLGTVGFNRFYAQTEFVADLFGAVKSFLVIILRTWLLFAGKNQAFSFPLCPR